MGDDIVERIRKNLPSIEWEQPLAAERERLAADEIERLRAVLAVAHKALRDLDPVDDRDVVLMSWWNQWRGYLALAEVETALKTEARHG